jgi:hypothetical protein
MACTLLRRHESAAEATASKVREDGLAHLTMVLFRDGRRDGGDAVAAILRDIVRGRADRYSVKEIDVQDRPGSPPTTTSGLRRQSSS